MFFDLDKKSKEQLFLKQLPNIGKKFIHFLPMGFRNPYSLLIVWIAHLAGFGLILSDSKN